MVSKVDGSSTTSTPPESYRRRSEQQYDVYAVTSGVKEEKIQGMTLRVLGRALLMCTIFSWIENEDN